MPQLHLSDWRRVLVGDSFQATGVASLGGGDGCLLTVTISGGSGVFANSSGTISLTYACSPDDNTTGSIRIHGTGNITFTITVDQSCHAGPAGPVSIGCQNQSVNIDPAIAGTPFELHYQSERVPGRSGASAFLTAFSRDLGGWTLNVRHAYDPVSGNLYLGTGGRRRAAVLGSPPVVNGNYLVTNQSGSEVYAFDKTGRHLRTLHPLTGAAIYAFAYDPSGRLSTITDSAGNVTSIQRDSAGLPSAILAPYGQRTAIAVNSDGFITSIANPSQETVRLTYASGGLLSSFTDALGNTDKFRYDAQGLLTHADHASGASEDLAASPAGVVLTTAAGVSTTFATDLATRGAQAVTVNYASGLQGSVQSTPVSFSATPPEGTKIQMTFAPDPRWGIQAPVAASTSVTTPGGLQFKATSTRTAKLNTANDPFSVASLADTVTINGRQSTATYTAATRTLATVSAAGRTGSTVLDAVGRIVQKQLGGLDPASFSYDARGRLATIVRGSADAAQTTTFSYNAQGYVSSVLDAAQRLHSYNYNAAGRITSETLPQGGSILYDYDANGNRTSLTPPGQSAHTWTFNPSGRMTMYSPPAIDGVNAQMSFTYNPDGLVTRVVRGGQNADLFYDNAGRLSSVTLPTGSTSYAYDNSTGNLATISGPGDASLALTYDGSLLTAETWTGPVSGTVSATFDNNFFLIGRSINGAPTITYQLDPDGLLVQAGTLAITRDVQSGLPVSTAIDNIADTFTYDSLGQETAYSAAVNGAPLYSLQYTRDAAGRVIQQSEIIQGAPNTYNYTYDAAGQLSSVIANGAVTGSYTWDANGNRLSRTSASGPVTAQYDAQDRLLSYGATIYSWSDDGQLLSRAVDGQATSQYRYDTLGRLLGVTTGDGTQIDYVVDGRGRRMAKKVNGVIARAWLYQDELRPVAELDASGNVVSVFVYMLPVGPPAYITRNGNSYRIVTDRLGSPRLVVDTLTGVVAQRLDYDEFGQVLQDSNPGFQPFGFAGGIYDPDTGLVRFGARDYDAVAGRWTGKDPTLFTSGAANLYRYVDNDPVNRYDHDGNDGETANATTEFIAQVGTHVVNKSPKPSSRTNWSLRFMSRHP